VEKFKAGDLVEFTNDEMHGFGMIESTRDYAKRPFIIIILSFLEKYTERQMTRTTAKETELKKPPKDIKEKYKNIKDIFILTNHLHNAVTSFLHSVMTSNLKADLDILKEVSKDIKEIKKLYKGE